MRRYERSSTLITSNLANEATSDLQDGPISIYRNASWSNWPDLPRPRLAGFDLSPEERA